MLDVRDGKDFDEFVRGSGAGSLRVAELPGGDRPTAEDLLPETRSSFCADHPATATDPATATATYWAAGAVVACDTSLAGQVACWPTVL